jgi:hypothetical protein
MMVWWYIHYSQKGKCNDNFYWLQNQPFLTSCNVVTMMILSVKNVVFCSEIYINMSIFSLFESYNRNLVLSTGWI